MKVDQITGLVVTLIISSGVLVLVIKQTYSDKDRINRAYSEGRAVADRHLEADIASLRAEVEDVRQALLDMLALIGVDQIGEATKIVARLNLHHDPPAA